MAKKPAHKIPMKGKKMPMKEHMMEDAGMMPGKSHEDYMKKMHKQGGK